MRILLFFKTKIVCNVFSVSFKLVMYEDIMWFLKLLIYLCIMRVFKIPNYIMNCVFLKTTSMQFFFVLILYVSAISYVHIEMVSSPYHTFSLKSLT